jgi:hypothetical protein
MRLGGLMEGPNAFLTLCDRAVLILSAYNQMYIWVHGISLQKHSKKSPKLNASSLYQWKWVIKKRKWGEVSDRNFIQPGETEINFRLKRFPGHCPLVLLVKVGWREDKAFGNGEVRVTRRGARRKSLLSKLYLRVQSVPQRERNTSQLVNAV